ncbi:MAG: hypothetical protein M3P06_11400 [Acidobacteriota bacterium]|nr:hypothetical protein [Acidobacteriota bacterium]
MASPSVNKAIRDVGLGLRVISTQAALASGAIFNTSGRLMITSLTGQVTVAADGGATTIKLQEGTGNIDLCAATTVTSDAIGTFYFLTGEVAVILNGTGNAPVVDLGAPFTGMPSAPIFFGRTSTTNTIDLIQTGDDATLVIEWILTYIPMSNGAFVTAP